MGALAQAALLEAQKAGKLRYIGFTGHKDPRIHLYMLEVARGNGFTFDAVQLPLNPMDAHFRSFSRLVLPELVKDGIGVLAMKTLATERPLGREHPGECCPGCLPERRCAGWTHAAIESRDMLRLSLVLSAVMALAVLAQENIPMPPPPSASRPPPPIISSITRDGVRYESRWSHRGVLFAIDEKSGKPLWQVEVYKYLVDEQVETDVQEVYFKSMTLDATGEVLLIEDESGVRHQVDLKTRKAKLLTWPVAVSVIEALPGPEGWKYSVELKISNALTRTLKLDGPSVAEKGMLSNNLFQVEVDGQPIAYHGMMAKRAPPGRFIELKPGATYRTVVELSSEYPIPPGQHRLTVKFAHTNHFSPDNCRLESKPVTVELGDEPIRRSVKPPRP